MSDPNFNNGLAEAEAINGSIAVSIINDRGMIDLRGDIKDKKFSTSIQKVLGITLPDAPRQSTSKETNTLLWLSPDQWLLLCPRTDVEKIIIKLQTALNEVHSLVVDVSDARTIFRLEGTGAKEVVTKGAPIDLSAQDCKAGYVRRLRFAEMAALIHIVSTDASNDSETIDLFVFRSYAQYAWDWLAATSSKQSKLDIFSSQILPPV